MIWEKVGLVKFPSEIINWAEHSLLQPTPFLLNEETVRIFCGMRDAEGRSRVGFIDINPEEPENRSRHIS